MRPDDPSYRFGLSQRIHGLSRWLNSGVEKLVAALGGLMVAVVTAQVCARYLLNHSLFWSEELARYLLVWLAVLGASAAYRRGLHPGIDIFSARLGRRTSIWVRIGVLAVSLVFFSMLIYFGTVFAHFVRLQITPALQLPKWMVFSILPAGGLLLSLHASAFLVDAVEALRRDG